ncbi:BspA family leucine-rich repeat surface protein [Lactiplantibacillus songbeiensis]|uniref:BspA family leucine-rich repeat surface protein n=1 Tax=Lactiplantibacillus songbeiensis TaxID=2559920 RepID=A0ABW4C1H8_9LACO|nr:BspA family leucine-rich repeat surface protein [Lactiplantibacillus songbeiensis]
MLKSNDRKVRFKLYKHGKLWVVTGITALVWQAGAIVGQADTNKSTTTPAPVTVKAAVDQPGKTAVLRTTVPDKQPAKAPEKPVAEVVDNLPTTKPADATPTKTPETNPAKPDVPNDKQPTVDASQQDKQPAETIKVPDTPKPTTPDQPAGNKPDLADSKPSTPTPDQPVNLPTGEVSKPDSPAKDDVNQGTQDIIPNNVKDYADHNKPIKAYTDTETDPHDHKTNLAEGLFGTSEWWIDDDKTLHIGKGELADTNIWDQIKANELSENPTEPTQPWGPQTNVIKTINFEDTVVAGADSSGLFSNMPTLTTITGLDKLDTSKIVNMALIFAQDAALTTLDLSHFTTGNTTNMHGSFKGLTNVTSLDLSHFDTSHVTDMANMLAANMNLTQLNISSLDTSQVTNMELMFAMDMSLPTLDISNFKTANVTNMHGTFTGMDALKTLDLSHLNTNQVTDMTEMLAEDGRLTQLDLSTLDTSHVTNMMGLFMEDGALEQLNLANLDTSHVIYMSHMFDGLTSLKSLDVSSFKTGNVIDMFHMFDQMGEYAENGDDGLVTGNPIAIDISNFDMRNLDYLQDALKNTPLAIRLGPNNVLFLDKEYYNQQDSELNHPQTSGLQAFPVNTIYQGKKYTGKWFDTKTHQVYTTAEVVAPYTVDNHGPIATYQQQSNFEVQDSTIRVNSKWQPSNNLISATDDDGSNVTFNEDRRRTTTGPQLSVYDQPNTQVPGNYTVVYNFTDSVGFQAIRKSKIIVTGLTLNETEKRLSTTAPWEPLSNVKLAVDAQGNTVTTTGVTATIVNDKGIAVTNFRTPGQYVVHYQLTGDDASVVEMPLTVFSLAKVTPKDMAITLGTTWQASDSFSAVDENGKPLTLASPGVNLVGTPDTKTPGNYAITYTYTDTANHAVSATAKVTVAGILLNQDHLQLVTTADWQPQTNLKTAVNADGQLLTAADLQITVTTAKSRAATASTTLTNQLTAPGTYLVRYQFTDKLGQHQATTLITVTSQAIVNATDQTLHVGDTWQPQAGFVSGTNEHGQSLAWAAITVTGQVNTAQAGQYPVTYAYTDAAGNMTAKTVTVTVLGTTSGGGDNGNNGNNNGGNGNDGGNGSTDNANDGTSPDTKPEPTPTEPEQPTQSEDAGVVTMPAVQPSPAKITPVKPISLVSPTLPQTDESSTTPLSVIGIADLALSSLIAMFKFAKRP